MEPLLLLHGALGAKNQFEPLFPLLPPDWPVYSFNLAGHGGAAIPEDTFSIKGFVGQLIEWLEERHLSSVQVFGYSMGGYIALEAARQQPHRFSKVFTLATKFDWTPATAQAEAAKLQPELLLEKVPAFAQILRERHAPQHWTEVVRRTADLIQQLGQQPVLGPQELEQISVPVRIAVGDKDQMVTVEESLAAYRHLPHGQFQVLPGTKHPLEQMGWPQLAQAVLHFFDYA